MNTVRTWESERTSVPQQDEPPRVVPPECFILLWQEYYELLGLTGHQGHPAPGRAWDGRKVKARRGEDA